MAIQDELIMRQLNYNGTGFSLIKIKLDMLLLMLVSHFANQLYSMEYNAFESRIKKSKIWNQKRIKNESKMNQKRIKNESKI